MNVDGEKYTAICTTAKMFFFIFVYYFFFLATNISHASVRFRNRWSTISTEYHTSFRFCLCFYLFLRCAVCCKGSLCIALIKSISWILFGECKWFDNFLLCISFINELQCTHVSPWAWSKLFRFIYCFQMGFYGTKVILLSRIIPISAQLNRKKSIPISVENKKQSISLSILTAAKKKKTMTSNVLRYGKSEISKLSIGNGKEEKTARAGDRMSEKNVFRFILL